MYGLFFINSKKSTRTSGFCLDRNILIFFIICTTHIPNRLIRENFIEHPDHNIPISSIISSSLRSGFLLNIYARMLSLTCLLSKDPNVARSPRRALNHRKSLVGFHRRDFLVPRRHFLLSNVSARLECC